MGIFEKPFRNKGYEIDLDDFDGYVDVLRGC